jgi:predicted ATPase
MPTLPRPPTSFVGRKRELARSRDLLSRTRLLTLTGPGGSGKTRLAIKLAGDIRAEYPDGVFFVPLAPVLDPWLVPSSIAQALSLRDISGRDLMERITSHLEGSGRCWCWTTSSTCSMPPPWSAS